MWPLKDRPLVASSATSAIPIEASVWGLARQKSGEKLGEKVKDEREPCYCQIAQMENKQLEPCGGRARVLHLDRSSFSHQECLCLLCVLWKHCHPAPESQQSKLYPTDNREKSQVSNRLSSTGKGTGEGTSTMQLVNTMQGIVWFQVTYFQALPCLTF